jgi:hypothetical protein
MLKLSVFRYYYLYTTCFSLTARDSTQPAQFDLVIGNRPQAVSLPAPTGEMLRPLRYILHIKYIYYGTAIMMFFKKIIEVHGYIGVKSNSKTFL